MAYFNDYFEGDLNGVLDWIKGLTRHGQYCGSGTACGQPDCGPPIDNMDRCCQAHDACYTNKGITFLNRNLPWNKPKALQCDVPFCACLARAKASGVRANLYRAGATKLFCPLL